MAALPTNYKEDIFQGNRKYQIVENGDGTVSFIDVTEYSQEGDTFGAAQINEIDTKLNAHDASINSHTSSISSLDSSMNTANTNITNLGRQLRSAGASGTNFYFDYKNGKYGWNSSSARGADTFHPFKAYFTPQLVHSEDITDKGSFTVPATPGGEYVIFMSGGGFRADADIGVINLTVNQKLVNPTNGGFDRWTFAAIIIGQATSSSFTIVVSQASRELEGGSNILKVYQIAD